MHMADALLSPMVGGTMIAVTTGLAAYSIKKLQSDADSSKIPLMGVMGAFIFAAQMINFTIPGTGSSGHIGGGMLLSILLGPFAGFLTMLSVLLIQAMFFGDGGLLAIGANVFNLGFFTCFIVYPLIYRNLTRKQLSQKRIFIASMASSIVGLQLGAFGVVLETVFSGKTELPFGSFLMMMQPIHLAIGIVEGLLTATIVSFVWKSRPEMIEIQLPTQSLRKHSSFKIITMLAVVAIFIGGFVSWFASEKPDGLEWSMEKVAGTAELKLPDGIHQFAANIQNKISVFSDYTIFHNKTSIENPVLVEGSITDKINLGKSVAGLFGGILTFALAIFTGFLISRFKKRKSKENVDVKHC